MLRNASPLRSPAATTGAGLRGRLLLALFVLLFAAGSAYGALVLMTRVDSILFPGHGIQLPFDGPGLSSGNDANSVGNKRINVLVLGLDRRPREGNIFTRTDTMIVVTIDPQTKTAGVLGIPRDLYVTIPDGNGGTFDERINTALEYGETYKYPGGGPKLAEDTIAQNLGINIDHYVIIDFSGFKEIIDSLGGIDVDVPDPLYDPTYSDTELPGDYFPLDFSPGMQHMDGRTALGYARSRNTTSDLDRIQRQQRIIFAVMDKALSLNVLPNALDLWDKYKNTISTDISDFMIPGFAKLAADIPPERISGLSLGACTTPWTTPGGADVLLPSEEGCQEIVQALFSDQQLLEEKAVVEIQDGSGTGVGPKALDLLVNLGFTKGSLFNSSPPDGGVFGQTEIVDFSNKTYTTEKLAQWLQVPTSRVRMATAADAGLRTSDADVLVLLGKDTNVANLTSASAGSDTSSGSDASQ
ncbi:MAG: LCP family protein [Dehalococcoidia bacterium]